MVKLSHKHVVETMTMVGRLVVLNQPTCPLPLESFHFSSGRVSQHCFLSLTEHLAWGKTVKLWYLTHQSNSRARHETQHGKQTIQTIQQGSLGAAGAVASKAAGGAVASKAAGFVRFFSVLLPRVKWQVSIGAAAGPGGPRPSC